MSENLPSPRRQTHHHSNIHASFSASAFSFLFFSFLAFLISFTFYSVFYGLQFLPIFLLNYSYSLSVSSFPSLLHLLWDNVLRVILRFFDSMSLLSKKRKFRRRERTMPGGHGAVQSAEVGVMQIWFSFNIKNGGFLIRWLSFFRLTDALLTW